MRMLCHGYFVRKGDNRDMEKETLLKSFGDRVRTFRKKRGFTQSKLSDAAGVTIEQISKIERGKSRTRIETAYRIATGLGVDVHELYVFDEHAEQPNPILAQITDELVEQDDKTLEYVLQVIKGIEKVRS